MKNSKGYILKYIFLYFGGFVLGNCNFIANFYGEMQKFYLIFIAFFLLSCEFNPLSEGYKKKVTEDIRKRINWKEIDSYPLFEDCNEWVSKELQRNCFELVIKKHLINCIKTSNLYAKKKVKAVVKVEFLINRFGVVSRVKLQQKLEIKEALPQLEEYIKKCLKTLPPIAPALKRNMEVNAKFVLPIIINIQ